MDASGRERVAERPRDMILPDHLGERRRPVLACEDQVRHQPRDYTPSVRRYNARVSQICLAWMTV